MTFKQRITKVARAGDDPRGDFIFNTRVQISRGRWKNGEVTSLIALRSKMRQVSRPSSPCFEAYEEAERCWREYHEAAKAR